MDIDLQDELYIFRRDICDRVDLRDTGIVDHDVEPANRLFGMLDRCVDLRTVADVGPECCGLAARLFNLGSDVTRRIGFEVDNRDVAPPFARRKAMPRPMPCATPVTSATFPLIFIL